jgi:hypothetical protein
VGYRVATGASWARCATSCWRGCSPSCWFGALGAWLSYRNALNEANAFFDSHLRETALLLRDQSYGFPGTPVPPK